MKIALDARAAFHSQPGGFRTYTAQLVRHLPRVAPQHEFLFYLDRPVEGLDGMAASNVSLRMLPARVPVLGAGVREQWTLPRRVQRDRADLAHFPVNTAPIRMACPFVVTLHDAFVWTEPFQWTGLSPSKALQRAGTYAYNRMASLAAARKARLIITDSVNSKRDLVQALGLKPERIAVVNPAPAERFGRAEDMGALEDWRNRRGLKEPFILALGSASPRKNIRALVAAYAQLDADLRAAVRLVFVWTHGLWKSQAARQVEELGLGARVTFLEQASDDDLVNLYRTAALFVFPSLDEGFGLPPLEAMACGTPVVASNLACLPEVLGDAAQFADPRDPPALARAIEAVLQSPERAAELRARGETQVRRYSWERCAREVIDVYERAVRERE